MAKKQRDDSKLGTSLRVLNKFLAPEFHRKPSGWTGNAEQKRCRVLCGMEHKPSIPRTTTMVEAEAIREVARVDRIKERRVI